MNLASFMLAQDRGYDYSDLAYLFILIVLPILNWIVGKYKEWQAGEKVSVDQSTDSDEDVIFDVSVDEDDEFVLRPVTLQRASSRTPAARPAVPKARPIAAPPPSPRRVAPRVPVQPPVARPITSHPQAIVSAQRQAEQRASGKQRGAQPKRVAKRKPQRQVATDTTDQPQINIAGIPIHSLRDAVVLSEILAPPLAIRQIDNRNSGFERPDF